MASHPVPLLEGWGTGNVTLNGERVSAWTMLPLPLADLRGLKFSRRAVSGPAFHRGFFRLAETGDTFFDLRGWGKGCAWVNGRNLGRHWRIGPQRTLFCPGVWLRKGRNEIVVLDLDEGAERSIAAVRDPVWETA